MTEIPFENKFLSKQNNAFDMNSIQATTKGTKAEHHVLLTLC